MATITATIDLAPLAKQLQLQPRQVDSVVQLLDDHNTVPFITRYRKDQTGGLDETQIRRIEESVAKQRLLLQRKQTILRSIDSQGKLTDALAAEIEAARSIKRLEDLYLPFKPKRQTLATTARERGLEPLAREILRADPACADMDARAQAFVDPDKGVKAAADALLGAGHILAEEFSERADVRGRLRSILEKTGKLVTSQANPPAKNDQGAAPQNKDAPLKGEKAPAKMVGEETPAEATQPESAQPEATQLAAAPQGREVEAPEAATPTVEKESDAADAATPETATPETADEADLVRPEAAPPTASNAAPPASDTSPTAADAPQEPGDEESPLKEGGKPPSAEGEKPPSEEAAAEPASEAPTEATPTAETLSKKPTTDKPSPEKKAKTQGAAAKSKKKGKDKSKDAAFSDYFAFSQPLMQVPPHRVLAINRGERAKALRVKIDADIDAMHGVLDEMLVPEGHPHAEFLRGCARDALSRLVLPSLEREVRRDLTERAESHAVDVFARNLRNLLLQPPARGKRILAIDPGYRNGCKLAALDESGNPLENAVVHVTGKKERREAARVKLLEIIKTHQLTVVAIGNGSACRETETVVADLIANELAEGDVSYTVVNEAGASVYSTSTVGREDFPKLDAMARGSISIGRRLLDPLSELVKIDPGSIGVGMYQHDVKAKHLQTSLDAVVESCVNYVGVDVNTASVSLLRYVSGLNQLTARRLFDYRVEHGPFTSREQLRDVPGFGDATYVQAAGFLRITGGACPLDGTWIHPESYADAERVLKRAGYSAAQLRDAPTAVEIAAKSKELSSDGALAEELGIGSLLLHDILTQLSRPGRDPREDLPPPVFRKEILKLDDLEPGMQLAGSVLNVVDFGAFVDIGLKDSGLVHISALANQFVADPHKVVAVGDVVKVWVLSVDKERRRVSLTMVAPGTKRSPPRKERAPRKESKPGGYKKPAGGKTKSRPPFKRGDKSGRERKPRPMGTFQTRAAAPPAKLTKAMQDGKEPLRTFGELKKFLEVQPVAEKPDDKKPEDKKPKHQEQERKEQERKEQERKEQERKEQERKEQERKEQEPKD